MKRFCILLLCSTWSISVFAQSTPDRIDSLVAAYTRYEGFSGSVLVAQKGAILLDKGYGYRNNAGHLPNSSSTLFQLGSITKQFTAALILQLAEQHRLSLQDKVVHYLPDFPHGDSITIQQLLTHTAGLFNYTNNGEFMKKHRTAPASRDSLIASFSGKPLDFIPGSQYNYSNSNYILLGVIIEKITGQSWFQAVQKTIFDPLQMTHSGFDFKALPADEKAVGYMTAEGFKATIVDSSVSFSAGAIYSTTGDLYKWDRALYTDRILSSASRQEAFTPRLGSYGYGWVMGTRYGKKIIEHGGAIPGFVSLIRRIPEDDICIIILENRFQQSQPSMVADCITSILYGKTYKTPQPRTEVTLDTTLLKKYVGAYELAPQAIMTISYANGQLFEQLTGQMQLPLYAEKEDFFFLKAVKARIEFVKGVNGTIEKLILHQGGQDIPGPRVKP